MFNSYMFVIVVVSFFVFCEQLMADGVTGQTGDNVQFLVVLDFKVGHVLVLTQHQIILVNSALGKT
jgi:hypothetical protein